MKKPPQIGKSAFVVIDTDGRICWSFCNEDKRVASVWAEHPGRKVARVEVVEIVKKLRKPKGKEPKGKEPKGKESKR